MYEIVKLLGEPHVTGTRAMTLTLARCCRCGTEQRILKQNVDRANRERREYCALCLEDSFHRMTGTRFWSIWRHMVSRASNPRDKDFVRYGAAGRGVCEEWFSFANFYRDMFPSYRDDLTIDRRDNSRGYSKENCRWVSNAVQQSNKINNRVLRFQGRDMHLAEFCRTAGVSRGAITPRLNMGMTAEEALADYEMSPYPKHRKPR
jgi:uncharacterized protein (DUF433 family)